MAMQNLGIRELSVPAITAAAARSEIIGITNGKVLAGVLVPCVATDVRSVVSGNLSRLMANIERGEQEIQDAMAGSGALSARQVVSEMVAPETDPGSQSGNPKMRRVALREVNGRLLEDAAARHQTIAVTTDRVMAGVIIPVSQTWVAQLVEANLPRILDSISRGEAEIAALNTADQPAE